MTVVISSRAIRVKPKLISFPEWHLHIDGFRC
jgi:hypothetical protein